MTAQESERLAAMEQKVDGIAEDVSALKGCISDLQGDVRDALVNKADWAAVNAIRKDLAERATSSDLSDLRKLIVGVIISVAGFAIATLVGLVVTAVFSR